MDKKTQKTRMIGVRVDKDMWDKWKLLIAKRNAKSETRVTAQSLLREAIDNLLADG